MSLLSKVIGTVTGAVSPITGGLLGNLGGAGGLGGILRGSGGGGLGGLLGLLGLGGMSQMGPGGMPGMYSGGSDGGFGSSTDLASVLEAMNKNNGTVSADSSSYLGTRGESFI